MCLNMRGLFVLAVVCLAGGPALADAGQTPVSRERLVMQQPKMVRDFVARRLQCNHWGGEEPYDAARRREISRAVKALRCNSLDRDEARLLRRYRDNAELPALLVAVREAWEL